MNTAAKVKKFFREKYNLKIRATTSPTKSRWIGAWIQPSGETPNRMGLVYNQSFPEDVRRKALTIIYGENFVIEQKSKGYSDCSAGNVNPHSISMREFEWEKFLFEIGEKLR